VIYHYTTTGMQSRVYYHLYATTGMQPPVILGVQLVIDCIN